MKKSEFQFRKDRDFETRKKEATRLLKANLDRVPVVCEPADDAEVQLKFLKFLAPSTMTVASFMYLMRGKSQLSPEKAIFLFTEKRTLPAGNQTMGELYEEHKDDDGMLYLILTTETTFGT